MILAPHPVTRRSKIGAFQWKEWFQPGDLLDVDSQDAVNADEYQTWTQVDDLYWGWLRHLFSAGTGSTGRHLVTRRPWDDP